jgi:uncharacterized protein YecT (DUF1311 family)
MCATELLHIEKGSLTLMKQAQNETERDGNSSQDKIVYGAHCANNPYDNVDRNNNSLHGYKVSYGS